MLRDRLRVHTRVRHERIEGVLDIPDSLRDRSDYLHLLGRLYGFYAPLEASLWEHRQRLSDVSLELFPRLKTPNLRHDLQSLGLTPRAIDVLPSCGSLPELANWTQGLGCLYVLEGATLGGQLIARRICDGLSLHRETELRFFLGYGARTGAMWRFFVDTLNAISLTADEAAEALQGAEETFDALERWMLTCRRHTKEGRSTRPSSCPFPS